MSFYKRYELVRLVFEDETKTFKGRQSQTGRPILLHMIDDNRAGEIRSLVERARAAPGMPAILESGDFAGGYYVVTDLIEPFDGLHRWLVQRAADRPAAAAPEPAAAPGGAADDRSAAERADEDPALSGRIRDVHADGGSAPARSAVDAGQTSGESAQCSGAGHARQAAAPDSAPAEAAPSEFSQAFGSRGGAAAPRPAREAAPAEPSEFSQVFGSRGDAGERVPSSGAASDAEPSEFSRIFGGGSPGAAPAEASSEPEQSGIERSGEMKGLFDHRAAWKPGPAIQSGGAQSAGEFSRLFGAAPGQPQSDLEGFGAAQPDAPAPERESGIGEFKKVFDPAPAPEPSPHPKRPEDDLASWPEPVPPPAGKKKPEREGQTSEFTRFFGSALDAEQVDIEAEHARNAMLPATPDVAPFQQPGEFTRVFGPGDNAKRVQPGLRLEPSDPALASKVFGADPQQAPAAASPTPAPGAAGDPPDEYSMILRPREGAPRSAPAPTPQPAYSGTRTPPWKTALYVFGGICSVGLIALLIYFIAARGGK
jgi:hypothetical protein